MITEPVRSGTAEQLARCWWLRSIHDADTDATEVVDDLAAFLIGAVGGQHESRQLQARLDADLHLLWSLMDGLWAEGDLDELAEDDWARHHFPTAEAELLHRYDRTRQRLAAGIENEVRLARYAATEAGRAERTAGVA